MPSVQYGSKVIKYSIQEREGLKSHYISVEKTIGVILKGKPVSPDKANKLILKKAKWILEKLALVGEIVDGDIVTGSRIPYIGKNYYTELHIKAQADKVRIEFNHSKFRITIDNKSVTQQEIQNAINEFYKIKAVQKISPRVEQWSVITKLNFNQIHFRKMNKRWGSCTPTNNIIININAIKLPYSLIDYLIVHELCHTKIKDHSKAYWAELSKHEPRWKELDEKVKAFRY